MFNRPPSHGIPDSPLRRSTASCDGDERILTLPIFEEFWITVDETTVGRELRAMGFAKLSARPRHHAQNEFEVEDFKKASQPSWRRSSKASPKAPRSNSGGPTKPG